MGPDSAGLEELRAVQSVVEGVAVAACLSDRQGRVVAANAAALALWKQADSERDLGFVSIRKANGQVWEGWPTLEKPSEWPAQPQLLVGRCPDGSEVEYVAYPSVISEAGGGGAAGLLELLFPLSTGTAPLSLVHGLTNALGVILGNVELAKEEMSSEYLEEIRNAALRARDILRQPSDLQTKPDAKPEKKKPRARLMCIDDDEAFLFLASRALQRQGHKVRTYSSAEVALGEFSRSPAEWDIIIIDNNLLGRDGLEIAREFLCEEPRVKICIASGAVDDVLKTRAGKAGVCKVVLKPATMPEFAELVESLVTELTPPPNLP